MPPSRLRRPLFVLTCLYILILTALRWLGLFSGVPDHQFSRWTKERSITASGIADSQVREERGGRRFTLETTSIETSTRSLRLLVHLPSQLKTLIQPGDALELAGRLRFSRRPRNPGDFDERTYLSDRGISGVFWASTATLETQPVSWMYIPARWGAALRLSMQEAISSSCPAPHDAVFSGIVLGDKHAIDSPLKEALKNAGAIHIIVPSGTNVAFIITFFLWLCRLMRLPPWLRLLLPLFPAGLYGLVVGADPPYLRAYLGAALAAAAAGLDRGGDSFQALTLSALLLLLHDPRVLFLPGFQMSFLVVFAILASEPSRLIPRSWPVMARWTLEILYVSVVAQLALAPLLAGMGGRISIIGLLANVILIPLSGIILGLGFILWLAWIGPFSWVFQACAAAAVVMASLFRDICLACAGWPSAAWKLAPFGAWNTLCYYLLLIALLNIRRPRVLAAWAALSFSLWTGNLIARRAKPPSFEALALTQARGTCLLSFPDGRRWLIYGNGPAAVPVRALKTLNVRRLDRLVWINPDKSGRRSLPRILRAIPTLKIIIWKGPNPFKLSQGSLRLRFGGRDDLQVFHHGVELRSIPSRLRWKALRIISDGNAIRIRGF